MTISVVVASWNDKLFLDILLNSLFEDPSVEKEVFVINDAPESDIRSIVEKYKFSYVETKGNCGPATAWNIGLALSSFDHVLILNSDAKIYSGFLRDILSNYLKIGHDCVVGPAGNLIDQSLKNKVIDDLWKKEHFSYLPVDWVGGFCLFMNRKKINRLRLSFDEAYRFYYEDADFCTQAWNVGLPVYFINPRLIPVAHLGGGATRELTDPRGIMHSSRKIFVHKWKKYYRRRKKNHVSLIHRSDTRSD